MIRVGVTGGIGAGKSMVSAILQAMGYPVFYSDIEAKRIIRDDHTARTGLISLFGEEIFNNNELNRALLAQKIFSDPVAKQQVNELIHPLVRKAFDRFSEQVSNSPFVFNEAAIFFETGAHKQFDAMVLVVAPEQLRLKRVTRRDNTSEEEVRARMANQWTDDQKIPLADVVIVNDEQQPLLKQIEEMLTQLATLPPRNR